MRVRRHLSGPGESVLQGHVGYNGLDCRAAALQESELSMKESRYGFGVEVALGYDQAIEQATAALKAEGFGVLTTIDVKATLKQKLDKDFRRYSILGACNPALAYRAFQAETEVGLLLPCNVIVYEGETPGTSVVSALAPMAALGIVGGNPGLKDVAREADEKLRRVLKTLGDTHARKGV